MKLLVFSPYYPPHKGGLESHSAEFNQALTQRGYTITVFTPNLPATTKTDEMVEGSRIIRYPAFEIVPNFPFPKLWLPLFWKQLALLKNSSPDIVITRTRFFLLSFIGFLFAKWHHIRHVHIEHGSDFVILTNPFSTFIAKVYDYTFGFIVLRFSTINISISEAVQKFILRFDRRNSPIIRRGLDFKHIDTILPHLPAEVLPYQDRILLVTVARLYRWKGIEQSIAVIRKLPSTLQQKLCFVIIGSGEDFDRLKKLSSGLPILLLGQQTNDVALALRKSAHIYLHSSFPGGGLSTSLLEAMYTECAVIATPHEGANEVIQHQKNGLIIQSEDEYLQALTRLIENEALREEYATMARQTIQENFSWPTSIQKYEHIFRNL
jgi:glycosyltransferase involved in cell wall biosynthesis